MFLVYPFEKKQALMSKKMAVLLIIIMIKKHSLRLWLACLWIFLNNKKIFFCRLSDTFQHCLFHKWIDKTRVKTHGFMFGNTRTIPKSLSCSILPALLQSILQKNLHLPLLFY